MAVVVTALPATAATGSTLSPNDTCANPVLAQNATGWGVSSGGTGSRVAITDHAAARYAYRVATISTGPTMTLPAPAVSAGQKLTFAADSQISSGGRVTMAVDFSMHQTMQLDRFPNGSTPTTPSSMNVAWTRCYAL